MSLPLFHACMGQKAFIPSHVRTMEHNIENCPQRNLQLAFPPKVSECAQVLFQHDVQSTSAFFDNRGMARKPESRRRAPQIKQRDGMK